MADRFQERGRVHERSDPRDQVTLASGVNLLAGIWLLISPWAFGAPEGALWNAVIVGIVIATLAATRLYSGTSVPTLSWVNAVLGAWMIAAPWVLGYTANAGMTWNSVIVGIVVLIFGVVSATSGEAGGYSYERSTGRGSGYADEGVHGYGRGDREPMRWGERDAGRGSGALAPWGEYRGVGPKGWQRSDEEISREVCARMSDHPYLDAGDIEVRVSNGEVILVGTVASRQARRLAEELADSVSGVRDVQNELRPRGYGPGGQETPRRVA